MSKWGVSRPSRSARGGVYRVSCEILLYLVIDYMSMKQTII